MFEEEATMAQADAPEIRAAIQTANGNFIAALRRGDAAGIAALYTEDAQVLPPNSDVMSGKAAIQAFWQSVIDMGVTGGSLESVEVEGSGSSASEVGRFTMEVAGGRVVDNGKYLVLWRQEGGQWKLHRDIWNSSRPAAS
jgi:uncharacterized protein (TIGR02246 family)